ncbi:hypothetical protein BGW80DRAFT_1463436 [Lactifluus volemus]|nr:hypothetical protein BGW80DRAFT_1463436 [Lactifluus volemus]
MEVQQMDVDVLSQVELSKLSNAMNRRSKAWNWALEAKDEDVWSDLDLSLIIISFLSTELSTTSNRAQFSRFTNLSAAKFSEFMQNLKGDELKKWIEGVRMGVKDGHWDFLAMHPSLRNPPTRRDFGHLGERRSLSLIIFLIINFKFFTLKLGITPKETELGLERIEAKLRAVQLALEILTGICATLPDPADLEPGVDDAAEDNDNNAMDEIPDDPMSLDEQDATNLDSHQPGRPFLSTLLLEPRLALTQPTSYPSLPAFECLSNTFLALEAAPGSAASSEAAPGSTRATVWDVAVGLLWGVGTVWTGKIVPEEAQVRALIALCDRRTDDDDNDTVVYSASVRSRYLRSNRTPHRIISTYLFWLARPWRTGTESMLQAVESLIDMFADERAPAEANFRAGNVLEALAGG